MNRTLLSVASCRFSSSRFSQLKACFECENKFSNQRMSEVLLSISRLAMLAFLLASMLGVGLSLTLRQIVAPLRSVRLVMAALVANFIVVPLIAVGTAKWFRLDEPFTTGLLLLGLAPGAPFLPKVIELAKGDVAFAVGLMVLLMIGSMIYLPVVLPRLLPGAKVGVWQIARPLVLGMFLPLILGLTLKGRSESIAARLRPTLSRVSNVSLLVVIGLVVALNLPSVLKVFGTGAIAAALLFTVLAGVTGYFLGGPGIATSRVMALGTAVRNITAALVIGEEDFKDPEVIVMLVIAALLGLILLLPVTLAWSKRLAGAPALTH
jgi:BASS family bile acid:Na+ symporter